MRFKTTLPIGCTVKAGSIPVRLLASVECESETPIKVDLVTGAGPIAMPDEKSIDDVNNNPANAYHRPNMNTMRIVKYIAGTVAVVLCCYLGFFVLRGAYHLVQRLAEPAGTFIVLIFLVGVPIWVFSLLTWTVGRGKSTFFIVVSYLTAFVAITVGVITLCFNLLAHAGVISGKFSTAADSLRNYYCAESIASDSLLAIVLLPLSLDTGVCILLILGGLAVGVLTEMAGAVRKSNESVDAVTQELCTMNATMNATMNVISVAMTDFTTALAADVDATIADLAVDADFTDAPTGRPEKGDASPECKQ